MRHRRRECQESVLLLGGTGYIGQHLLEALLREGYRVTCGVHASTLLTSCAAVAVDYSKDHAERDWLPRLAGVDVVINCVGILRETESATFDALHIAAPGALFRAAFHSGVKKVIQVSALGADGGAQSGYHRSKKAGDDALAALDIPWVIVQPSLIFGPGGASARLFSALAALPLIPLPGHGEQRVQPVRIDDVVEAIVRLMETDSHDRQRVAAVGAKPVTLREFLSALRQRMKLGRPRFVPIPMGLVRIAAAVGDRFARSLLDRESLGMLVRGNVASAAAITSVLGREPAEIESFITPAHARTAAHDAKLAWLLPLLRLSVALVWIVTGILSLGVYPLDASYALLERVGLTGVPATTALYSAGVLDLALGVATLLPGRRRWLWRAQIALIAGYSAIITVFLPEYWLHPFGPLTKNLPMIAAILTLHELEA